MASDSNIQLDSLPGFLFRRLHQLAVARFSADMSTVGLTPVQWAALVAASQRPGLDQVTLSKAIYIDASTIAGVLDRLESRGLLRRTSSPDDRRVRQLYVTDEGAELSTVAAVAVGGTQEWLLEPLSAAEQDTFMKLMLKVLERRIDAHPVTAH